MNTNQRVKIALQKKGRLNDDSLTLLKQCGLSFSLNASSLIAECTNFPLDLILIRDDDIPSVVNSGVADLGIVGENVLYENVVACFISQNLGFCDCRLSIAVPSQIPYSSVSALQGKRIATSYPRSLGRYLTANGVEADIINISGSVEVAPRIGMADAICDLVSSGRTLRENNLIEKDIVLESEAVLIRSRQSLSSRTTDELIAKIQIAQCGRAI